MTSKDPVEAASPSVDAFTSPVLNDESNGPSTPHVPDLSSASSAVELSTASPSPAEGHFRSTRDELNYIYQCLGALAPQDLNERLEHLTRLEKIVSESHDSGRAREDFVRTGGFLVLIQVLSSLGFGADADADADDGEQRRQLFRATLSALALVITADAGHYAVFVESIGWQGLTDAIEVSEMANSDIDHVFACLLGLAGGQVDARRIESFMALRLAQHPRDGIVNDWSLPLLVPHALEAVYNLSTLRTGDNNDNLVSLVHLILGHLGTCQYRNRVASSKTSLPSKLLKTMLPSEVASSDRWLVLPKEIYETCGLSDADGRLLLQAVAQRTPAHSGHCLDVLHQVAHASNLGSSITFDMSLRGHSSLAFSSIRKPFPPATASNGWSLFTTIEIRHWEEECALDLVLIFDAAMTCSTKLAIVDHHLQYTPRPDVPPLVFKGCRFVPGRQYHFAFVHERPKANAKSSLAQLFVDGAMVEQQHAPWPTASAASDCPTRVVFGTAPGPAPRPKAQVWSMGPAYMMDQCIPAECALVLHQLGNTYSGNLQDSLGRFLTYQASTKVNLRLDALTRSLNHDSAIAEKELARHPLVTAIAGRQSDLFKEERFYFAINAQFTAIRNRRNAPVGDARPEPMVVLNQAVTLNRDAMAASYGYAKLYGSPILNSPTCFGDTIWKHGGCGLLLHILDGATDSATFDKSLDISLTAINQSWRLCEDAEKMRAYEVLNVILRRKSHLITPSSLLHIMFAVGIDAAQADQAALINPYLYRVVVLDFELWAQTTEQVQIGHLAHLTTLLRTSKHRRFNIKRVAKMQIVKRLLYRLRSLQQPSEALARQLLETMRTLLVASWSDSALRAVTSYLAAELCRGMVDEGKRKRKVPKRNATLGDTTSHDAASALSTTSTTATAADLPLRIFELVTLLALDRPNFLIKLGQTINIKWLLLFLHPQSDRRAAVLAFEVLSSLLVRQPSYIERLSSAGGWKVLERLLPRFWEEPAVIPLCFCVLFGHSRQPNVRLGRDFGPPQTIHCGPMLRVILNCYKEALAAASGRRDLKSSFTRGNKPRPSELLEPPTGSRPSSSRQHRHARKRSNSMNIDAQSLADSFKENRHHTLVKEVTALIQTHAAKSTAFREVLFLPLALRALIEAIEPFLQACVAPDMPLSELNVSETACYETLTMLAKLSTESMCLTGSTDVVSALMAAIPPRDLAHHGAFRSALIGNIMRSIRIQLPQTPPDSKACAALAHFIEDASHDILQDSKFGDDLFEAATLLLSMINQQSKRNAPSDEAEETRTKLYVASQLLHGALNRVVLYRLSTVTDVSTTLENLLNNQSLLLGPNADTTFVQCLANRVLHFLQDSFAEDAQHALNRQRSWDMLKLIVLSRPDVAAEILPKGKAIDDVLAADVISSSDLLELKGGEDASASASPQLPLTDVWDGFLKSAQALQTATHLQRIGQLRQLLDQSDARESAMASTERRMIAWHHSLSMMEDDKYSKHVIDHQEMRQAALVELRAVEDQLKGERGLLATDASSSLRVWQLDPLEGPRRMRKRLMQQPRQAESAEGGEPVDVQPLHDDGDEPNGTHGDPWGSGGDAQQLTDEPDAAGDTVEGGVPTSSSSASGLTLGDDLAAGAKSAGGADDMSATGPGSADPDDHEHKFRKVLRSLERGDKVEGVVNASRVVGIDCRAALCITGKGWLYLVDDYFQRSNGELVNVWQAPEAERDAHVLAALSSSSDQPSALIADLEGDGQTRKWAWSALRRVHRRTFLHRKTALELFFEDGQSCLLVLPTVAEADALNKVFGARCRAAISGAEQMRDGIREPSAPNNDVGRGGVSGGFSARLGAVLGRQTAGVITEAWRQRKISNFDYLMKLNTLAGRSFNDLSQYPVFPWVIADYTSSELDLTNPDSFRKLHLPMGAQTSDRREQFEERYESLVEINETPFHYGTHFSTAATTAGYLIRLRPFDKLLMALQGGSFDLAERTFASIEKAWKSSSEVSRGDVRELTPEFFYLPDFLVNSNRFDFGSTQAGAKIDDVELPPWAKGDPLIFVQKNREALESEYVSQHLHHWIDLVFGYRQSGAEAVAALNVFHPLSYAGEVDLEEIQDPDQRRAALQTVWNFGVCPTQLFERPHATRYEENAMLGLGNTPWMAIENMAPLRTIKTSCHFIHADPPEKAYASPADYLILPKLGISLSTGHLDGSIRMFKSGDPSKAIALTEQAGIDRVLCIAQAGPATVLTGCRDGLVLQWKVDVANRELVLDAALRGHTGQVTCLAASQQWRIAVSGSDDATAIVWDTNRGSIVRTLAGHAGPVQHIAVDDEEGYIATSSGQEIFLWSINGSLLAKVGAGSRLSEPVTALNFGTRDVHQTGRLALLLTGHKGKVVAWSCEYHGSSSSNDEEPQWTLRPFHMFEHRDRLPSPIPSCNVTAVHVAGTQDGQYGRYLFVGDEAGRLNVWTFPGDAFGVPESFANTCMNCDKKWGVLEARRTCRGCGGLFCSACAEPLGKGAGRTDSTLSGMRFCSSCRDVCIAVQ